MLTSSSNRDPSNNRQPIVFYDGGCPLCSREIAHYQRLDRLGKLRWVDIDLSRGELDVYGLEPDTAMQRFHVLDASGDWQTGAWGFVELWGHLPRYRWLSRFCRYTRSVALLDRAYSRFALWRSRRRCSNRCQPSQTAVDQAGNKPAGGENS